MKNKNLILLFFFIFLYSCSDRSFIAKKDLTQLTLSSVAGYLGYQWSDADIFTTIAGSGLGYLLGGYVGDFLEQDDYFFYKRELFSTLDFNEIGTSGYWKNSKSGNEGVIVVKSYFNIPECRLIEHIYVVKNSPSKYFDTACRKKDGTWQVIR